MTKYIFFFSVQNLKAADLEFHYVNKLLFLVISALHTKKAHVLKVRPICLTAA